MMTQVEHRSTVGPGTQAKLTQKQAEAVARAKREDAIMKARATEGVRDQETLDAVLALGGDATRSSPVREQVLPDADPGLTTTTGAYRVPIDPTTAAVPAPRSDPDLASGTPTIGSGEHGKPEERWKKPEGGDTPEQHLMSLPTKEEYDAKDAEAAKEVFHQ
jgi:hypothetical protein